MSIFSKELQKAKITINKETKVLTGISERFSAERFFQWDDIRVINLLPFFNTTNGFGV